MALTAAASNRAAWSGLTLAVTSRVNGLSAPTLVSTRAVSSASGSWTAGPASARAVTVSNVITAASSRGSTQYTVRKRVLGTEYGVFPRSASVTRGYHRPRHSFHRGSSV